MNLLSILIYFGLLGAVVLAPVVAAGMVYVAPKPIPSPVANWLGLSIGGELGVAFPLYALFIGLEGPAHGSYYLAYVFAAAAPALAFFATREHLQRLRGRTTAARRVGFACLGMAALVAIALIPWILGAPLPPCSERSGMGFTFTGDIRDYAWVVLPFTVAMEIEAWLLIGWPAATAHEGDTSKRWDVPAWLAAIGLAVLVLGAMLLLPPSRWNSRNVSQLERVTLREQAESLDSLRRMALAEIVAGRAPALLADPCPTETTPESWRAWQQFDHAPKDWDTLLGQANAWQNLEDVNLWHPGPASDETPRLRSVDESSKPAGISLLGPLRRAVFARLENESWISPWFRRDLHFAPEEARRLIRPSGASESWNVDATLILRRETISYAVQGTTNLGSLAGTLWVWSYREQAFVCASEVRVLHAEMHGGFHDPQAHTVRDSIRMRALAQAVGALRAVERRQ